MGERRSDNALTDAILEREIERALAVDPSPEFLARVRMRIASEPARSAWHSPWTIVIAGSAAAVIVAGVLTMWSRAPERSTRPDAPVIASRSVGGPVTERAPVLVPDRMPAVSVESPLVSSRARRDRTELAVLIPPDEAAALKRLLSGVPSRPLELTGLTDNRTEFTALQPLKTIELAPIAEISAITIEPLRTAAPEKGVRQ
jgi:hypothetical protein